MQLPEYLRRAIEGQAHGLRLSAISEASAVLSASYRESPPDAISSDLDRIAYLIARLPSTYSAARAVLLDVSERLSTAPVESILDLGAGPGTAAQAAAEIFPGVRKVTFVEGDEHWIDLGKSLCRESPHSALRNAAWEIGDLTKLPAFPSHDLVLLSYVAGELDEARLSNVLRMAWDSARLALIIVEPGTPRAFSRLRFMRRLLLHSGAHMVGPCPHEAACPMAVSAQTEQPRSKRPNAALLSDNDWCHFAARVERTSLQRLAKGGTLSFEDEKYSYVAVSRVPVSLPDARIVRRPIHTSGSVILSLCTAQGLRAESATRRDKSGFRRAKKAAWGEVWEPPSPAKRVPEEKAPREKALGDQESIDVDVKVVKKEKAGKMERKGSALSAAAPIRRSFGAASSCHRAISSSQESRLVSEWMQEMTPSRHKSFLSLVWALALTILLCSAAVSLRAQSSASTAMVPHGSVSLIADASAIQPNSHFLVAFHFTLEPGWHIYWINPGDSGEPPRLIWHLPAGIQSGAIEWPAPKRLPAPGVMDFGYTGDVALLVPMHAAALAPAKQAGLAVQLKLVVCRELCIPGSAQLSLRLPVGSSGAAQVPAQIAGVFAAARNGLPKPPPRSWKAEARQTKDEFILDVGVGQPVSQAVFFPLEEEQVDNTAQQPVESTPRGFRIHLKKAENLSRPVSRLRGVVEIPQGAFSLDVRVSPPGAKLPASPSSAGKNPVRGVS